MTNCFFIIVRYNKKEVFLQKRGIKMAKTKEKGVFGLTGIGQTRLPVKKKNTAKIIILD